MEPYSLCPLSSLPGGTGTPDVLPIRGERWQLGQIPERRATVAMASVFPARLQRLCALPSFRGVPRALGVSRWRQV